MSTPRRKREEEPEEHENHERWLVSYADMITVLMALFIVLFAISSVDQTKFLALRKSLASSFGNPITAIAGGPSVSAGETSADGPLDLGAAFVAPDKANQAQVAKGVAAAKSTADRKTADETRAKVEKEIKTLDKARRAIVEALRRKHLDGSVQFRYDERGLVVSVVTDKVLFASDLATLSPAGTRVLDTLGPVLQAIPNDLAVEGHTNLVAAPPKFYPSEWELSSARATTVVRHLIDASGLAARRMSATGYAGQRPLIKGTSALANRVNRRVEIVIVSTLPPQDRALIKGIAPTVTTKG